MQGILCEPGDIVFFVFLASEFKVVELNQWISQKKDRIRMKTFQRKKEMW